MASSLGAQVAAPAAAGPARPAAALAQELTRLVPQLQEEAMVPGVAVALVEAGHLAWAGGFGMGSARHRTPVTTETVFEAASLSKPVFAYAVLQLAQRGVIDLDAPLTTYMRRRYVDGEPLLDRITARHVLSNTTGFPNWRPKNAPLQVHFVPGERFSYSGEGYAYLQEAVENATGQPLETLMQELVFTPLGMTSSSYIWRSMYEDRKATGHDEVGEPNVRREPPAADAASSLHTTAGDYARFVAALLRGEGLSAPLVADMWSPQVTLDATCMVCIRQPMQAPSAVLAWGLGWGLETATADTTLWHWGDNEDMNAFVVAVPSQQRALIILTNGEYGLTLVPAVTQRFLGRTHAAFAWLPVEPLSTPVRRLHRALLSRGTRALEDYLALRRTQPVEQWITEQEMTRLGHELVAESRVGLAIAVFRQAAADYPLSLQHLVHLGGAYLLAGNGTQALATFERILAIAPNHPTALGMIADIRAGLRR